MSEPVIIADYDPAWPEVFQREATRLVSTLTPCGGLTTIEHIGSTAVPNLAAKPIIDIMIGIGQLAIFNEHWIEPLASMGHEYKAHLEEFIPERRFCSRFETGEPSCGKFHLHIVEPTSAFWDRHLLFRDYLRANDGAAAEYAALKHRLAEQYQNDRPAYTDAKSEFIEQTLERARSAKTDAKDHL